VTDDARFVVRLGDSLKTRAAAAGHILKGGVFYETPHAAFGAEAVSAADANRKFSLLLRGVREGQSYVVTSHGRPVARIVPAGQPDAVASRSRTALLSRLERQPVLEAGRWTRDELYEDER